MKNYELIIERLQPPCGGKDNKVVSVQNVATDNPLAYVRSIEKDGDLKVETRSDGEISISLDQGLKHISYTFTEV